MDINENFLKDQIVEILNDDFLIHDNVKGQNLVEQTQVFIDYMLYPKQHLIEAGFEPDWIGLEVKFIKDFSSADRGKKSHLLWQAITYSQSKFMIDENNIDVRPYFVVVYIGDFNFQNDDKSKEWWTLLNLAQYGSVGWLQIIKSPSLEWVIDFNGGRYYSQKRGRGNLKLPQKRHVGTT